MEFESIEEKRQKLLSIRSLESRSREFCRMMEAANQSHYLGIRRQNLLFEDLKIIIKDTDVFARVTDSLLFALKYNRFEHVVLLREKMGLDVHEVTFTDGKSLLHWLVEQKCDEPHKDYPADVASIVVYLLRNATVNHRDAQGFTYFHGACMLGDLRQVQRFVDELGVDVDLDTYALSPLYIAAKCRRVDTVRWLLLHCRANPNWFDARQGSRVLHGLARLRRCDCPESCRPAVEAAPQRSAVDAIVELLVARGARIDARNRRGLTPLEWAVSRLDYDLTRALLRHGASLSNLNENLSLSASDYMQHEFSYYPIVLYVPEMIELLSMHGFRMNFDTRLKFLKFWTTARKHEMDDMSTLAARERDAYTWNVWAVKDLITKAYRLDLRDSHGFFIGEKAGKRLEDDFVRLRREVQLNPNYDVSHRMPRPQDIVRTLAGIRVKENITLLQICQMSYRQASSILKSLRDWRLPHLGDEPISQDVVKRHIGNVLMRPQLELFATDSFMMDHCTLGLPYVANRTVVGFIDDEDLIRLCEDLIRLRELPNENEDTSFIRLSFYIFLISLTIGIIFMYINN